MTMALMNFNPPIESYPNQLQPDPLFSNPHFCISQSNLALFLSNEVTPFLRLTSSRMNLALTTIPSITTLHT